MMIKVVMTMIVTMMTGSGGNDVVTARDRPAIT